MLVGGNKLKKYRFSFNLQYANDLRDAVNDRPKQSIDKTHSDKSVSKKSYWAWNRICAAMDRLEDAIIYFNDMKLGSDGNGRSAFDFYNFINNAYILIDCIKTIGRIFNMDEKLIDNIEKSSSVFGKVLGEQSTDGRYFEYIRSVCVVHPLGTNRQKEFLDGCMFHCCPFVTWNERFFHFGDNDADLIAHIYTSREDDYGKYIELFIPQFEEYITKWIDIIPEIIKAKNSYTDSEYERLKKEPVKTLADFSNDIVKYLVYLKTEYCKRFDYGNDYLFNEYIRVFTIKLSDKRNKKLLEKYKNAILYSLNFVRNELQNMSYEGYENSGIKYPDRGIETTLFDSLDYISTYESSFSKFSYELEKIYYLEPDHSDFGDKLYAQILLEGPKALINKFVNFTNTEPDEERIVLVNLARYLEALTRKSLLNRNIPNFKKYRTAKLSKEEYEELFVEEPLPELDENDLAEFKKIFEEYGV